MCWRIRGLSSEMNRHWTEIRSKTSDKSAETKLSTTITLSTHRKNLPYARNNVLRVLTNYHT